MPVDTDAEILALRNHAQGISWRFPLCRRAWVGREPAAVAAGLADALIGLLQLDFVFRSFARSQCRWRLRRYAGEGMEGVFRNGWRVISPGSVGSRVRKSFPTSTTVSSHAVGSSFPIGVNAEGGVVAAACDRIDFPTEIDQLLLCLAANHAATNISERTSHQ